MSKISDELREFAYLHFSGSENVGPCDALMGIADELEAKTSSCGHQGYIVVSRDEVIQIADRIRKLAKKEDRQCQ